MTQASELNWGKLVRINKKWVDSLLVEHPEFSDANIKVRAYSINFDDKEENMNGLVLFMRKRIKEYVFTQKEIETLELTDEDPWVEAAAFFGDREANSEGKYGELLLFLLVESVIGAPMIAHKIRSLSDYNDQVKGADGVFFGEYDNEETLLLGESKMIGQRARAITEALNSVNNFHNPLVSGAEMKTELTIAKNTLIDNLSPEQLERLMKVLNYQSKEYLSVKKAHPILIVYDENQILKVQNKCANKLSGENLSKQVFRNITKKLLPKIKKKISLHAKELNNTNLDFFFIPVSSVNTFRTLLYNSIHLHKEKEDGQDS